MENPIYLYDLVAVILLAAGTVLMWRRFLGRTPSARHWLVKSMAAFVAILVAFLLLHVWAQVRPIPVFVVKLRPFKQGERDKLIRQGWPWSFHTNLLSSGMIDEFRLNEKSAAGISESDIFAIKRLLAWERWLPLFPKKIVLSEASPAVPSSEQDKWSAVAYYKMRNMKYKQVHFERREGKWNLRCIYAQPFCGPEPKNVWDKISSWMPIDFKD